jgi:hypothetical protein
MQTGENKMKGGESVNFWHGALSNTFGPLHGAFMC